MPKQNLYGTAIVVVFVAGRVTIVNRNVGRPPLLVCRMCATHSNNCCEHVKRRCAKNRRSHELWTLLSCCSTEIVYGWTVKKSPQIHSHWTLKIIVQVYWASIHISNASCSHSHIDVCICVHTLSFAVSAFFNHENRLSTIFK